MKTSHSTRLTADEVREALSMLMTWTMGCTVDVLSFRRLDEHEPNQWEITWELKEEEKRETIS